jgi:hypothetical protein
LVPEMQSQMQGLVFAQKAMHMVEIFGVLFMNIHEGSPGINGGGLFTKDTA